LLVSVRDADEALIAWSAGASIIDVKEPSRGSLGKSDWPTIRDVAKAVGQFVPVSIALGELCDFECHDITIANRFEGISFAKLGLSNTNAMDWRTRWSSANELIPNATRRVAVAYADWQIAESPAPRDVIDFAAQKGCDVVLVDTFDKNNGGLLDVFNESDVAELINRIRDEGMKSAMAGSLSIEMIENLIPMKPDIIAVRGAACVGDRTSRIDSEKVRLLANLLVTTTQDSTNCRS
jgi:uncharacterized protein (UPF0264 family)